MRIKFSTILISLGLLFLLNAIFGRYIVLPGYLASLDQGQSTVESVSQTVSAWKIIRYLLWAYSFKLGIYSVILGAALRTKMPSARIWVVAIGGFIYLGFAYMPLPSLSPLVFGVAGRVMTLMMVFILLRWVVICDTLNDFQKLVSDSRIAWYFFFGMATYNTGSSLYDPGLT